MWHNPLNGFRWLCAHPQPASFLVPWVNHAPLARPAHHALNAPTNPGICPIYAAELALAAPLNACAMLGDGPLPHDRTDGQRCWGVRAEVLWIVGCRPCDVCRVGSQAGWAPEQEETERRGQRVCKTLITGSNPVVASQTEQVPNLPALTHEGGCVLSSLSGGLDPCTERFQTLMEV